MSSKILTWSLASLVPLSFFVRLFANLGHNWAIVDLWWSWFWVSKKWLTAFLHQFSSQWLSYAICPWYNRSQCEFWTVNQLVCIFWIIYRSLTCFSSRLWKSWGTLWIKQSKGTTLLVNTLWVEKVLSKTWDQRTRAALISWRISTRVTMLKFVSIVGTLLPFSAPLLSHLVDKRTQINVRTGSWLTLIFRGKGKKKFIWHLLVEKSYCHRSKMYASYVKRICSVLWLNFCFYNSPFPFLGCWALSIECLSHSSWILVQNLKFWAVFVQTYYIFFKWIG